MTTPESFAPGYRLTDGNQLNFRIANPQWSTTSSVSATSGGTMQTSAKVVNAVTNITNASVPGAGVTLPQAIEGTVLIVSNNSGNDVRIFADGDSDINGLDGHIGILLTKGTTGIFTAVATKQWSQLNTTNSPGIVTLDTVSTLKLLKVNTTASVFVEGYNTVGDGGGGEFYGATGPAGTFVDNGGTIIIPSVGPQDGSVAWLRIYSSAINVLWFGADRSGNTNSTNAIQKAFDTYLSIGYVGANFNPNAVYIPPGKYVVSSLTLGGIGGVGTKDLYYKTIWCDGLIEGTNNSGPVLTIEGMEFCNFYNLRVKNTDTASGTSALKISRSYSVNWFGCETSGGEYGVVFQGNANNFVGCIHMGASQAGFGIVGDSGNTIPNIATNCTFQNNTGYGFEINRTSGTPYAQFVHESCYFENNQLGHARVYNNLGNVAFNNCFFAMNYNLIDGIVIGGTLSTETGNAMSVSNCDFYANNAGLAFNCISREAGTAATDVGGLVYSGNTLGGYTNANTVLGFTSLAAGSSNQIFELAFNARAKKEAVSIQNFDFSILSGGAGSAPTIWQGDGINTITSGSTISAYGYGNAIIFDQGYVFQSLTVVPYRLYRVSAYAKVTNASAVAGIQFYNLPGTFVWQGPTTSSTTPVLLEGYWYSGSHSAIDLLLREITDTGSADVEFSEIRIVDVTSE